MPDLEGGVITADALHLHDETIAQVREDKNGHMLIGLKGNRETLLEEVIQAFSDAKPSQTRMDRDFFKGHGRVETRIAEIIPFHTETKYPHLETAVKVERIRKTVRKGKTVKISVETSYYVATFKPDEHSASVVQGFIRNHWAIENRLHHVKDRTTMEDRYRAKRNVGANIGLISSIVVMIKSRLKGAVRNLAGKLRAGAEFAIKILFHDFNNQAVKRIN